MPKFNAGDWVVFKEDDRAQLLIVFGFAEDDMPLFVEDIRFEPDEKDFPLDIFPNGQNPDGVWLYRVETADTKKSEWVPEDHLQKFSSEKV